MTQIYLADGSGNDDDSENEPNFHVAEENIASTGNTGSREFEWDNDDEARAAALMFASK